MIDLKFPLSNVQVELLKLYSTNLNDDDIKDLKNKLAEFYASKAIGAADKVWEEKNLSNEEMDKWLNKKS